MRLAPWVRLAPSLPSLCRRSCLTTMAAVAPEERATSAPAPIWAGLLKQGIARHKHDPAAKYCQLATAAVGGGASCRTWVFRGFYEDTAALKFITDRRSQKIPEIAMDSAGEVCFYLKKTREQFRVKGRLQVVDVEENDETLAKARRHQWTQISPASQASFATSLIPGLEIENAEAPRSDGGSSDSGSETGTTKRVRSTRHRGRGSSGEGAADERSEGEASNNPVSGHFCLVLLWPQFVDHLVLGEKQTRNVHSIQGGTDGGGVPIRAGIGATGAQGGQGSTAPQGPVTWVTKAVNP